MSNRKSNEMECFFKPKGVALVGATANPNKGAFSIWHNLKTGFRGPIYPVNPRYTELDGQPCYSSVRDVPDPVELVIVFVPAPMVLPVVRDCVDRGIPGVIIESAGFAETGETGKKLQDELTEIIRESDIRIWGPNCMGVVDAVSRHVFSFVSPAIWDDGLPAGDVSLVVQSGMLSGGFLIDLMSHGIMGVSKVCSIGNKADVDECDLLEYLIKDSDTRAICLYIESIKDGRRFLHACRSSRKPIVLLQGGKSEKGAVAAMSHTASLSGNGAVWNGAMDQAGVVRADDFNQMMDLGRSLAIHPEPLERETGRVAVVTFSGAAGIVSADFMDRYGLELADLSENARKLLKGVYPEWMPVSNPIDLWPAIERSGIERAYGEAIRAVYDDSGVDAVLFHIFLGGLALKFNLQSAIEAARAAGKPTFFWLLGKKDIAEAFQKEARDLGVPVFRELSRAVECMAAVLSRKRKKGVLFKYPGSEF